MRILSVVGARPQFVKLAPIAAEISRRHDVAHTIIHTGQHYDENMSAAFFADLAIPAPGVNLEIGSGPHGQQTGRMLEAIEGVLSEVRPDWTLVYGDTNSTLAGALAAAKLNLPVAHLEAGLRSFNRRMPEEHNRVLTDHCADLLLAPTLVAMEHLATEGLSRRSVLVGDVMTDVCLTIAQSNAGRPPTLAAGMADQGAYVIATIHRGENTDDPDRLAAVVASLKALPIPIVLLAHPRLRARAASFGVNLTGGSMHALDPLPYPEMVSAVQSAAGVVTDSGGLQKEAYLLGTPCTTIRAETEWPETLVGGWNQLAPSPPALARAVMREAPVTDRGHPFGDGRAAAAVVDALSKPAGQVQTRR